MLARESVAMAADAEVHLAQYSDPRQRILEGLLFAIGEIRRRPVHAAVFGGESAAWAATQAMQIEALHRIGTAGVRPLVEGSIAAGAMSERDMVDLVDWILRILISYAAVPGAGGRTPAEVRRQLAGWFVPAFEAHMFEAHMGGTPREGVRH